MTDSRTETAMTTAVGAAPVAVAAGTALTAAAGPIALATVGAVGAAVAVRALAKRPKRPGQSTLTRTAKRTQSGGGAGGRLGRLSTGMPRTGRAGGKLGKTGGKTAGKTGGLLGSRSAGAGGQKKLKSKMNAARAASSGGLARKSTGGGKNGGLFGGRSAARSGGGKNGGLFGGRSAARSGGGKNGTKRTAWSTNPVKSKTNVKAHRAANRLVRKARREIRYMEMRRIAAIWRRWMARRRLRKKRDEVPWFRRLWEAGWNAGVWVGAAATAAWHWSALRARRLGRRGRSLLADMRAAAAVPFSGLRADWAKFVLARFVRRSAEAGIAQGSTTPVTTSTNTNDGGAMSDNNQPAVGPRTNLRTLIESIHELDPLGGGEKPHASVVHQWHKDLTEAMEVLSNMIQRDAEVAASTLPSEGAAHEITASLSGVLRSTAEQTLESTTAWELAQGSRLTRLYNGDTNEVAWDVSTMPD